MRRTSYFPYICFVFFLFGVLNFPSIFVTKIRSVMVSSLIPPWNTLNIAKLSVLNFFSFASFRDGSFSEEEYDRIKREEQSLLTQLESMRKWLLHEDRINEQMERLKFLSFTVEQEKDPFWKDFYRRRAEEVYKLLQLECKALPAKVIYREPVTWSSFIWLNIGEKQNRELKKVIVAKNSPVVVGSSIVGVVEEVQESKCLVRLITDRDLILSVRAVRGNIQNEELLDAIQSLESHLSSNQEFFASQEEEDLTWSFLENLKRKAFKGEQNLYLAKGELRGTSSPLWRGKGNILKGFGFNYDFEDLEGPARDLRTGRPLRSKFLSQENTPILKQGDLLVTTGFDGVFPPGLHVAIVSEVGGLREGSCSYEIAARPTCQSLNHLTILFVLPPMCSEGR